MAEDKPIQLDSDDINDFNAHIPSLNSKIPKLKVLLIGGSNAGKTSLVRLFTTGVRCTDSVTLGSTLNYKDLNVRTSSKSPTHQMIRFEIHDLAGSRDYRNATTTYYRDVFALVCVFDITSLHSLQDTIEALGFYEDYCKKNDITMPQLRILIGNKCELEHEFSKENLEKYASAAKFSAYFDTSVTTGKNISNVFTFIGQSYLSQTSNDS